MPERELLIFSFSFLLTKPLGLQDLNSLYGILVPQLRIEPGPPAVEARSPDHWATRNSHRITYFQTQTAFKFQRAEIVIVLFITASSIPSTIYDTVWVFSMCTVIIGFIIVFIQSDFRLFRIKWKLIPESEASGLSHNFLSSSPCFLFYPTYFYYFWLLSPSMV